MNVLKIQETITSGNTDSKQKQKRKKEWKKKEFSHYMKN